MKSQRSYCPSSGQDPIEWFCQRKSSDRPFEFSSLIVALAVRKGLAPVMLLAINGITSWQAFMAEPILKMD